MVAFFSLAIGAKMLYPQPGGQDLNLRAKVLDLLFVDEVAQRPYLVKLALRFGDSDSETVLVIYPGGKGDLISYDLGDLAKGKLSEAIERAYSEKTNITANEIAAQFRVRKRRTPIEYNRIKPLLSSLERIHVEASLPISFAMDDTPQYEYLYDNWQESIRLVINKPRVNSSDDELIRWMHLFRDETERILDNSTASATSRR
jgi:hypothetical protein